ncbi:MAG: aldolase/citrate lyase family protein [Pseudodonghicola sp.]|nr:aldolase/citrate lyase family protein [Pseudodonghicola sp.]
MSDIAADQLRSHLQAGEPVELFWFSTGSPALVEIAAAAGPQAIMLDAQHGLWSREGLEWTAGQLEGRVPLLIRTADLGAPAVTSALDAGAIGVLAPMVETADQALAFVAAARFAPEGRRSGGGIRPLKSDFARYYMESRAQTVVGVMIETRAALENAEQIAAVPGLDFLFIGTGDLALSMGEFPVPSPAYEAALTHVREVAAAAGLPCGIFTGDEVDARRRIKEGFSIAVSANDISVVAKGFATATPLRAPDPNLPAA